MSIESMLELLSSLAGCVDYAVLFQALYVVVVEIVVVVADTGPIAGKNVADLMVLMVVEAHLEMYGGSYNRGERFRFRCCCYCW